MELDGGQGAVSKHVEDFCPQAIGSVQGGLDARDGHAGRERGRLFFVADAKAGRKSAHRAAPARRQKRGFAAYLHCTSASKQRGDLTPAADDPQSSHPTSCSRSLPAPSGHRTTRWIVGATSGQPRGTPTPGDNRKRQPDQGQRNRTAEPNQRAGANSRKRWSALIIGRPLFRVTGESPGTRSSLNHPRSSTRSRCM